MTDEISNAIDRLVPPDDGSGDWSDVLARAGVTRPPAGSVLRRRRRLLVAVATVVVVAAIAAPALALLFGWIDRREVSFAEGGPAPNIVKKQFYDLGIRPGPRFAAGVQAGRAREVGKYLVRGKLRALWVAPTRNGGFCFLYEGLFSGCRAQAPFDRAFTTRFVVSRRSSSDREAGRRPAPRVIAFEGYLTARDARRIVLVYRDGARATIPFVYVSSPIDAGFFAFAVPHDRQTGPRAPVRALLLDATGRVIARNEVVPAWARRPPRTVTPPLVSSGPRDVRTLPTRLPSPPKPPLQRGSGDGASVTVGANGVAIWRTSGVSAERARLLRGSVTYTCFRLTRVFGFDDIRARGIDGAFAPQVAVGYVRLGRPLDGCDIAGPYGHRWPDRFGSHSPVEIALTPRGRRFFADRAAARDLALFVRSRRMQEIRKLDGAAFERRLNRAYPRLGRIRYTLTGRGVSFSVTSSTGKRFEVVVRDGRIVRENLKPYAVVF